MQFYNLADTIFFKRAERTEIQRQLNKLGTDAFIHTVPKANPNPNTASSQYAQGLILSPYRSHNSPNMVS